MRNLLNLMDPANPVMSGVVQNQDSYMKGKIAQRWYYDQVAPALDRRLRGVLSSNRSQVRHGRALSLRRCRIHLVGMGSYMETAQTTVDYLREEKGIRRRFA